MKKNGKKLYLTAGILFLAMVLNGCGGTDSGEEASRTDECEEVLFFASDSDSPTAKGGIFELAYTDAHEDRIWYYDDAFALERLADGEWEAVPELKEAERGSVIYRDMKEQTANRLELDWSERYGSLEPGTYCVVKEIYPPRSELLNYIVGEHMPEEAENLRHTGPDKDAGVIMRAVFGLE